MLTLPILFFSAALLLAMVLNVALQPRISKKLTTGCMLIAVVGGLIFYGTGFAETTRSLLLSIIRTPFCVIRMFVGIIDLGAIEGSRLVSGRTGLTLFWLVHLLAFYSMASAAMMALGAEALRYLRLMLIRRGNLTLIYGINEDSIALGKECLAAGDRSVVFIAESADNQTVNDVNSQGMSVLTGSGATASDKATLRKLHIKKDRKIEVYALDREEDRNLFYALQLKDALETAEIPPEKTRVTLPGVEDILTPMLQATNRSYGFGYVNVFDPSALTARALIRLCPPWDQMRFREDGICEDDFECVIVGFGNHGQAVLRELVMNAQFVGSVFRATVFSPNLQDESGYLKTDSPAMLKQYSIRGIAADARSIEFYDYIGEHLSSLKLIAVCTGREEMDREISDHLMLYLKRRSAEQICVVRCGEKGVRYQETVGSPIQRRDIYTLDFLSAEKADRLAILLNAAYDDSARSDWEKWMACDSFGKKSSRASADFTPAFIRATGSSRGEILAGNWQPDQRQLEILGQMEHLRWCAFHYAMGYSPMSREEYDENAGEFQKKTAAGQKYYGKIGKNPEARTHACLIPWEELDELSQRESAITGKQIDYKQTDINNVLALPRLIRAENDAARGARHLPRG